MQGPVANIFVVDDDESLRSAICILLERYKYDCTSFASAQECLTKLNEINNDHSQGCDLIIADVKMPEKSGIELLNEIKSAIPWLPVILMTAYANVPMTVQALKTGAFDFIEKPIDEKKLINVVESALLKESAYRDPLWGKPLTRAERIVLRLILEGIGNKRIAYILERSERTIEVHRSRIMRKLGVDNIVDLVKRATAMGFSK